MLALANLNSKTRGNMKDKVKAWFTPSRKKAIKSYMRSVLVSFLTFLTSNELGLPAEVSVPLAAIAGPLVRAIDKKDTDFGLGSK